MSPVIDLLFLGTGASSVSPELRCLTRPKDSSREPCSVCLSTLSPDKSRNVRGTTAGVIIKTWENGRRSAIMIDCGKTFLARSVGILHQNGVRKIDGVFLSHVHADAIQGLDDLRAFTQMGEIQESLTIYCSHDTYEGITCRFPWLINSGAGRPGATPIASINFQIWEWTKPIVVAGITVKPVPAPHGKEHWSDYLIRTGMSPDDPYQPPPSAFLPVYCAGFEIDKKILWMSDINGFPASTMEHFKVPKHPDDTDVYDIVALDCCNLHNNHTHIGVPGFLDGALRFRAKRTLAVQMTHEIDSYALDALGRMVLGGDREKEHDEWLEKSWAHISQVDELWDRLQVEKPRIGAAYDGMRLRITDDGIKGVVHS